jgi:hypothetical protein
MVHGIEHRTLAESLRDYFRHPEWKSGNPCGVGVLPRRHVFALCHRASGKESNAIALMTAEDTDGVVGGEEAGMDAAQVFDVGNFGETLQRYSVSDLARVTCLAHRTIHNLRNGKVHAPSPQTLAALARGLATLGPPLSPPATP